MDSKKEIQHVYLVGAKSLGAYGGYETFVYKLTEYHQNKENIKYHVACKANGDGCMEHFQFPEGFWFEDTPLSFMIAAMPYRCAAIKDIVYGYRFNPQGITATARKKKRAVESYWITEACLEEFPIFSLSYDQRAYEYLLRQSLQNEGRTRHQPYRIRKAQFVLTAELMERYFAGFKTRKPAMEWVEEALRKRQFVRFDLGTLGI